MVATRYVTPTRTFDLKFSFAESGDIDSARLDYDAHSDTLVFSFTSDDRPTVGISMGTMSGYWLARVDPETEEVVGMEIEHFAKAAVYENPELFAIVEAIGIPQREVGRIRRRLQREVGTPPDTSRAATKRGLVEQLLAGIGGDGGRGRLGGSLHPA
jgi:hypothetical protein